MVVCLENPKCREDDGDRLCSLPEPVIHQIFSFMETIDVVRASAVSQKWRYLWLSVPYLSFDMSTISSNPQEIWSHEKFKDFVNWVLLSQSGSVSIQRFRLYCLSYTNDYTVYRWVCAVARRNVQVFDLTVYGEVTELPHCLVTCESLEALKLACRQLRMCVLKLPFSVGFSRLKSLDLHNVEFLDHNLLHKFVSSRRLLEKLILKSCSFRDFKILDISSTSLKSLTLDNFGGDESGNYKVKIACPNLVSFNFLASWAPDFAFEDLDSLQNAFIFFDIIDRDERDNESCHILSKLLNELCEVKALKLSTAFLREDCDDWKISNKSIFCLTCHLKTVELIHVAGDENELELVRFLLKNGHVLKKLSFSWMEDVENRKEIISRIMKLPRSSSNVALEFLEPKPHDDFLKY
ncbi:putative F-box/FBD/LRR-repeat protein [Citrus sinensis]|uniref:F-box/FBD/LRR-repeat protein n=1 Tax=Citrus sinensis TaxID=2711 RepID=A0ACB8MDU5_CITSI|nr:putative F-box/FBD/LRR-repeat protein At1g78760 isoform X2 [Citrus x clementina]KAH9783340.1 putative F-box/FBD/LRR-repeat protein [Citrus sinensis]